MTAILDGDVRPQSKRDDFKRQYKSTINRINGYLCCQLAMKLTAIPVDKMTNEEKQKLDKLNDKAKTLEWDGHSAHPTQFWMESSREQTNKKEGMYKRIYW